MKKLLVLAVFAGVIANIECATTMRNITVYFDKMYADFVAVPVVGAEKMQGQKIQRPSSSSSKSYLTFPIAEGAQDFKLKINYYRTGHTKVETKAVTLPAKGKASYYLGHDATSLEKCKTPYCASR